MTVGVDNIEALTLVVADWLEDATFQEVFEYGKGLLEQDSEAFLLLQKPLIAEIRTRRSSAMSYYASTNAYTVLPEHELLTAIIQLQTYDADSVARAYKKMHPALTFSVIEPGIAEWAAEFTLLWTRAFRFLTVGQYLSYSTEFKSFIKLGGAVEQYETVLLEVEGIIQLLSEHLFEHNFEAHKLPTPQKQRLRSLLEQLTFFPKEYIERIVEGVVNEECVALFEKLRACLDCISVGMRAGVDLQNTERAQDLLWEELALALEEKMVSEEVKASIEPAINPAFEQTYRSLTTIVRQEKIASGECDAQLRQYVRQLTTEQKQTFLIYFERFLRNWVVVKELFGVVDPEYFIDQIKRQSHTGSKTDFINSLESRVLPEYWPITQKLMLTIASLL